MDKLSQQELIRIRRGAEDAIQAMNRNHKSFIDAVSHPLNIIALVDMAQSSIGQQAKVGELQNDVSIMLNSHKRMSVGLLQQQSMIEELIKERDELQKRINIMQEKINEVIDYIGNEFDDFYLGETNSDIHKILTVDLEKALKGEG